MSLAIILICVSREHSLLIHVFFSGLVEPYRIWDIKSKEALDTMLKYYNKDPIYEKAVNEMRIHLGEEAHMTTTTGRAKTTSERPTIFRNCRVLLRRIITEPLIPDGTSDDFSNDGDLPAPKKICRVKLKKLPVTQQVPITIPPRVTRSKARSAAIKENQQLPVVSRCTTRSGTKK